MNIEAYREYCLNKEAVTEGFPFDKSTLVFKVAGKMFALCNIDNYVSINLKCDPERAVTLREEKNGILPGYHMSKIHWNTVLLNSDVNDALLTELIDHSYELVKCSLTKKVKAEFGL